MPDTAIDVRRAAASLLAALWIALMATFVPAKSLAQGAFAPWRSEPPDTVDVVLRPLANDPDSDIVRGFLARDVSALRPATHTGKEFRIETVLVGRARIAPGSEPQIVATAPDGYSCSPFGCNAVVLAREGGEWVKMLDPNAFIRGGFGSLSLLAEPIEAVLMDPDTLIHEIPVKIAPVTDGRRTILWTDYGYYWNGKDWDTFCWRGQCR
jgi:hypothetical protein